MYSIVYRVSVCVSVYDLDDDGVGRRRPTAGSIIHVDYITIVSDNIGYYRQIT